MKTINKHVENTMIQIDDTLEMLHSLGFLRLYKEVQYINDNHSYILTWQNHASGRYNSGRAFTTLNQYVSIYESGAYHAILFDGSIIRVYFQFKDNILKKQNLLFWPSPISIPDEDIFELGIRQALEMYLNLINCKSSDFHMRTPMRFDYDYEHSDTNHPETHLHMQHSNCRLSVKKPMCFNTFIKFIFNNFYPELSSELKNLELLNYSGYNEIKNSVINI